MIEPVRQSAPSARAAHVRLSAVNGGRASAVADGLGRTSSFLGPGDGRTLRVLVLTHEEIVHWGFKVVLTEQPWVERCLVTGDVEQACELARRYDVNVALVEVTLAGSSGLEACERLVEVSPQTHVLLMGSDDGLAPPLARAAGAAGVVSKSWSASDLAMAVRMVGVGMTLFESRPEPPPDRLSQRERDVIRLIASGATNREIADRLYLSPNTVKQHASALYRKLEARNRAEAVQRAQRLGLIG